MATSKTEAMQFEHASAMPASTWNHLRMNDAVVEISEGLAIAPNVAVKEPWRARGAQDEFENALADAQEEWEAAHPAPTAEEIAAREEFLAAEADATYGGTAQSAYQIGADAIEESRSLAVAFEHGTGEEVAAYLRYAAGDHVIIETDPDQRVEAQVIVTGEPDAISAAAIDVIAAERSEINLSLVVQSPSCHPERSEGSPRSGQAELPSSSENAFTGTTVRVFADADARVNVVRTQALAAGFTDIDDMGIFTAERAHVDVKQTVLGASSTFTGLATDLRGDASRIDIATHYLGHDDQVHDFNYIVRHHGQKTECDLQANGVLAGTSSKTLRGTIDLIRGAKGAQGSENETVLLVDDGVHNKTVPTILCNEDDVAGNHGATIGHIRDEQMFYLASRGLSREAAERMFVSAIMEGAAIDAPDDESRAAVVRLGETVTPGFATLFEE